MKDVAEWARWKEGEKDEERDVGVGKAFLVGGCRKEVLEFL